MRQLTVVGSREISVIIQGPLCRQLSPERNIFTCIASIRKYLPEAEIIVSTWDHEDTSGVQAEKILRLEDPGCFVEQSGNQINTNRMLKSTLAGIQAATRPYVMKFRADHNLTSAALAVIGLPVSEAGQQKLFDLPVTMTTLFIRNPRRVPLLFHISDLVQFGTREAMLALWDQPLLRKEDILHYRPFRNPLGNFIGFSAAYRIAEQSLMLGAMQKQGINVRLNRPCQVRLGNLKLWDCVLKRNFTVLDYDKAGVDFPERFFIGASAAKTLYTASDIERLPLTGSWNYRLRLAEIWFNQYVLSCLRLNWWVSLASIILFSNAPGLAKTLRSYWRKIRKVTHPDSHRT